MIWVSPEFSALLFTVRTLHDPPFVCTDVGVHIKHIIGKKTPICKGDSQPDVRIGAISAPTNANLEKAGFYFSHFAVIRGAVSLYHEQPESRS